jgi:glycerol-3-phosphate acyltransferase PlsY
MEVLTAALAALIGYLFGAFSFARFITARLTRGQTLQPITLDVPDSAGRFTFRSISATTVRVRFGPKYGCLTSVLDMLKLALPVAVLHIAWPDVPYHLIAATFGVIGHNWPIYYRFQGGRGQSPLMGALVVIDPIGLVVTTAIGLPIGQLIIKRVLAASSVWIVLLIPWFWLRGDLAQVAFAVAVNAAYWIATVPELREYRRLKRDGQLTQLSQEVQMWDMGRGFGRFADVLSGRKRPAEGD